MRGIQDRAVQRQSWGEEGSCGGEGGVELNERDPRQGCTKTIMG